MLQGLEKKLSEVENENLFLKEREITLLNQINSVKIENVDLRIQSERFSFFAQKE